MIAPGSYLEYLQDKKLTPAVVLRQDKPGKIYVRNLRGREEKLVDQKALFVVPAFADPQGAHEDLDRALAQAQAEREELSQAVSPAELWELLGEEEAGRLWTLEELSELALGDSSPRSLSATYRSLDRDKIYSYRKGTDYVWRTPEQVQEICHRQEAEAINKREREILSLWLSELWQRPAPCHEPLNYPAEAERAAQDLVRHLGEVAVWGAESRRYKEVTELLKAIGITRRDAPFQLMLKAGEWGEHQNLALYRYKVPVEFEEDELAEAAQSCALLEDGAALEGRLDLTELEAFTIDDASTTDIDDALTFEEYDDGRLRVGIHIADASHYVRPGSLVDQAALERGTALYLPDLKVPMCPPILSDSVCSLVAGQKRLSFSFLVTFDPQGELLESQMSPSIIKVRERLTYEEAERFLAEGRWAKLLALVRQLKERRLAAGAVAIPFPRVNVKVSPQGEISIERESPDSPAQVLVSELMILANSTAGDYLAAHGAPGIFRSQEPPEKPLEDWTEFDPVKAYNYRRYLRRGTMGSAPARHIGLGLDNYVQVTSPIRRYNDLVMQRQLKSMLTGDPQQPLYDKEALEVILAHTKASISTADALEKERRTYWILRYLEEHSKEEMEAIVLANHPDKHIVQLCNCLWENECPHVPGHPLPPGSRIHVKIDLVWPRDATVRLSPIVEKEGA